MDEQLNVKLDEIEMARNLLLEIGMNPGLIGFGALAVAIGIVAREPLKTGAMTKELYPEVGNAIGKTASQAERAMRTMVDSWFDRVDVAETSRWFPCTNPKSGKVSNKHFVSRFAIEVGRMMEESKC